MNLREPFEYRSARVIAAFRAVLAVVFFFALVIEPDPTNTLAAMSLALIGGYLLLSYALMLLAWHSWWYDQQLAPVMLFVDIAVFLVSDFVTASFSTDFTSPFLALFALIILSATLRRDWAFAARTGVMVALFYVTLGMAVIASSQWIDMFSFARRSFYMVALLLVLVWFGLQRREPQPPALELPPEPDDDEAALWGALDYAMALTGGTGGVIVWNDSEEPWFDTRIHLPTGRHASRVGPESLAGWEDAMAEVRLFDGARRRKLVCDSQGRIQPEALREPVPLAQDLGIRDGLSIPFRTVSGEGLAVITGIRGPGPDYVRLGTAIGREIGNAFDRGTYARLARDSLVTRTRSAVARDLHDSVAQSLAGACFRLEALRRGVHDEHFTEKTRVEKEILVIRDALRTEQSHVRGMINTLRGSSIPSTRDLSADVRQAMLDAATHWGVEVEMAETRAVPVAGWFSHEVQQLLREAVANAARHGHAHRVSVEMAAQDNGIALHVGDDGKGFETKGRIARPWSISERVSTLAGTLMVDSGPSGTHLHITLPTGAASGATR